MIRWMSAHSHKQSFDPKAVTYRGAHLSEIPRADRMFEWIGIGESLAAPPLPHHRAYRSRTRRFGGLSGRLGDEGRQTEAASGSAASFCAIIHGNPSMASGNPGLVNPFRNTCAMGTSSASMMIVEITAFVPIGVPPRQCPQGVQTV